MIVSHKNKFIFLHIPKTAGTSVRNALLPYANPLETTLRARFVRKIARQFTPYRYVNFRNHPHWSLLKAQSILPNEMYANYLKFCFVRHPVDWQHSMFRHILSHSHLPSFQTRFAFIYKHKNFEDYIKWRVDNGPIPQAIQMLNNKNEIDMDKIARFEFIQQDFANICSAINISATLPFLNSNKLNRSLKISDSVRSLIYQHYKIDYDLFGYSEEGLDESWVYEKNKNMNVLSEMKDKLGPIYDVWGLNPLFDRQ
jgi:hypothetical protein